MEIISFPVAADEIEARNKNSKIILETLEVTHNRIVLGPFNFQCVRCDAPISFSTESMIFRVVEFYCSSCGHLHKVSNPAFTNTTKNK